MHERQTGPNAMWLITVQSMLAGLLSPSGMQSTVNFLFTTGRFCGSKVTVLGPVLDSESTYEHNIMGSTGMFLMARGYSFMRLVPEMSVPDKYSVYRLDPFIFFKCVIDFLRLISRCHLNVRSHTSLSQTR